MVPGKQPAQLRLDQLLIEITDDGDLATGSADQIAPIADDLVEGDLAQMFNAFWQRGVVTRITRRIAVEMCIEGVARQFFGTVELGLEVRQVAAPQFFELLRREAGVAEHLRDQSKRFWQIVPRRFKLSQAAPDFQAGDLVGDLLAVQAVGATGEHGHRERATELAVLQ